MKALVIGASGMLGRSLVEAATRSGFETLGAFNSRPITGGVQLDITDSAAVEKRFAIFEPDVVFLCVMPSGGADYFETYSEEGRGLNVEATETVAKACKSRGARIVYYSSDYVFDGLSGPYDETDIPRPINEYGRTKLEAERSLVNISPDALIIRTTAVFEWDRQSPNFAMQVWDRLSTNQRMQVPDDQIGNPTLASYLAEASVRLVGQGETGVFNIVGADLMPRYELGRALARAMALNPDLIDPVKTSDLDQLAPRPLKAGLTTDKLKSVLGTAPPSLRESLKTFRRRWRADTYIAPDVATVNTEAESLKQEILGKVEEYYRIAHTRPQFVPYESRVQYSGRVFDEREMVNLVDSALDFWLTMGPWGDAFETKMRRFFQSNDFVAVNSGSSANLTAVMSLMSPQLENRLRPGDEVITPAVTFPTTFAPIVHSGLRPVVVDCELGTYNIDVKMVEEAISSRTRAIMVPHTLGNPCDLSTLQDIASRNDLFLVEDACDALGATWDDKLVGTFGDLATLSFYPAHHITMGEGGGVIVNTPRMSRIVRSVRDWGRDCWCATGETNTCGTRFGWQLGDMPRGYDHKYIYSNVGYNFKPTDMQAAIGVAQADRIDEFVDTRRKNFRRLYEALSEYEDRIILPSWDERANPSWFGFPITTKPGTAKIELTNALERANIETREIFAGNILAQPGYSNVDARVVGELTNTNRIMRDTFFIGVYPGLTDETIDFTIEEFMTFFRK